jgi:heterodisulfide reductase subunit C
MSKQNSQSKDFYSICDQKTNKFFNDVEGSLSEYQQSITDYQRECAQSCRKMFEAFLSIQQQYAQRAGISSNVPEAVQKITNDVIEASNKALTIQNKMALATIDTGIKNIKTINDNVKSFADMNRSIIQDWQSIVSERQ